MKVWDKSVTWHVSRLPGPLVDRLLNLLDRSWYVFELFWSWPSASSILLYIHFWSMELLPRGTPTSQLEPQLSLYKNEFYESLLFPTAMISLTLFSRLLKQLNSRISSSYIMHYLCMIFILALCYQPSPISLQLWINDTSTIQDLLPGLPLLFLQ